jgi:ATP-dependent DNA helicase
LKYGFVRSQTDYIEEESILIYRFHFWLCLQGNQLDFLLSKASEYSNFIAKDLDELQASMTEQAQQALQKTDKKRRKGGDGSETTKKQKMANGSVQNLESVQAKDAMARTAATAKPIFIQPANLAADCFLKDYQLEGVRWLASLFENGVSGILADGTLKGDAVFVGVEFWD